MQLKSLIIQLVNSQKTFTSSMNQVGGRTSGLDDEVENLHEISKEYENIKNVCTHVGTEGHTGNL